MAWINIEHRFPEKEGYYRCACRGFNKTVKCKFKKGKNGPKEWSPNYFVYRKRVPFAVYWREYE